MADQRLAEASEAIAAALAGLDRSDFQDLAGEVVTKLTRAINASKASPEALDEAVAREDRAGALRVVLRRSVKPVAKNQVKICLIGLLSRPRWAQEARRDPELKGELLAFLREFKEAAEICSALEDEAPEASVDEILVPPEIPEAGPDTEEELRTTRELLRSGFVALKEVGFVYPTGASMEADRAIEGFGQLVRGVQRCINKLELAKSSEGVDMVHSKSLSKAAEKYEAMAQEYEPLWPHLLEFFVTLHQARTAERLRVQSTADKLVQLSPRFAAACAERDSLPWSLPLPPPATAPDDEDVKDEAPAKPKPQVVIWIDKDPRAYSENVETLTEAGLEIRGFHDDFKSDENKGVSDALACAQELLNGGEKELLAVVHSRGPTHKAMLAQLQEFCERNARAEPFFAACTKGGPEDFEGCHVKFCDRDRVKVQEAVVQELGRRRGPE